MNDRTEFAEQIRGRYQDVERRRVMSRVIRIIGGAVGLVLFLATLVGLVYVLGSLFPSP